MLFAARAAACYPPREMRAPHDKNGLGREHSRARRRLLSAGAVATALLAGCATPAPPPPPANPFVGTWATADNDRITFRDDTVVINQPNGPGTVMGPQECRGKFRFGYERKNRDALTGLVTRQEDLRRKLVGLLPRPDYPVAEMGCDQGDHTYVLLGDNELLAIYRDGDIAGLDRLSRVPPSPPPVPTS